MAKVTKNEVNSIQSIIKISNGVSKLPINGTDIVFFGIFL